MADVFLVAVVEVEKADRIICQAPGCGRSVHRRIHVVLDDKVFTLLGSQCFQALYGDGNKVYSPYYYWGEGRRLTDDERSRLIQNTAEFIEQLEVERLRHEANAGNVSAPAASTSVVTEAPTVANRQRFYYNANDPSAVPYDGPALLRWKWIIEKATAASLLEFCQAHPTLRPDVKVVAGCYAKMTFKTPYLFVLEVELRHCMPKKNAMRALHELGLIEPI